MNAVVLTSLKEMPRQDILQDRRREGEGRREGRGQGEGDINDLSNIP